jgi:hypothetical protein
LVGHPGTLRAATIRNGGWHHYTLRKAGPVPYTAFLALANRIEEGVLRGEDKYMLVQHASKLVQVLDAPPFPENPQIEEMYQCDLFLADFHHWLESHRPSLEERAAAEHAAVAEAQARMNQVSLCR